MHAVKLAAPTVDTKTVSSDDRSRAPVAGSSLDGASGAEA